MRLATVLLLLAIQCIFTEGSMDWCEYWTKMGKQRPECIGYTLPESSVGQKRVHLSPLRSRNPAKKASRCDATEMLGCANCESRCDQQGKQLNCEKPIFEMKVIGRRLVNDRPTGYCGRRIARFTSKLIGRNSPSSLENISVCGRKRCARKVCICRGDLHRDALGNCIESCPRLDTTLLSSMKQMVPLLLKDMWRSVFRAFRSSAKQMKQPENNITFIPA